MDVNDSTEKMIFDIMSDTAETFKIKARGFVTKNEFMNADLAYKQMIIYHRSDENLIEYADFLYGRKRYKESRELIREAFKDNFKKWEAMDNDSQ